MPRILAGDNIHRLERFQSPQTNVPQISYRSPDHIKIAHIPPLKPIIQVKPIIQATSILKQILQKDGPREQSAPALHSFPILDIRRGNLDKGLVS